VPADRPAKLLTEALLDQASGAAREHARLRRNLNLHRSEAEPCNRLLNAIEPGSYVAPHRHLDPTKDETIVAVRGSLGAVLFDDGGEVVETARLEPGGACFGVDLPHATFHTVVALAPGTVFFEAKAGPYSPLDASERAPWAPAEGTGAAAAYLRTLEARFAPATTGPVASVPTSDEQARFDGCIIAESLRDPTLIRGLDVWRAWISPRELACDDLGTSTRWHIYWISCSAADIDRIQAELEPWRWYAHFWRGESLIVIFCDARFHLRRADRASWAPAIEHGRAKGIPEDQLDFLILSR
jgi:cupin fold WbuC family metalloprotein